MKYIQNLVKTISILHISLIAGFQVSYYTACCETKHILLPLLEWKSEKKEEENATTRERDTHTLCVYTSAWNRDPSFAIIRALKPFFIFRRSLYLFLLFSLFIIISISPTRNCTHTQMKKTREISSETERKRERATSNDIPSNNDCLN